MNASNKPALIFPSAEQVPAELLGLKRWVGYRLEWDDSKRKWKKPPYSPGDGSAIGAVEKYIDHWLTFADAVTGAQKHGLDGVGFVFKDGDGYVGIDFDDCITDGQLDPAVAAWLKWFPSYTETSPSGTGLHTICKGKLGKALTATPLVEGGTAKIEMYSKGRYFTFTGQHRGVLDVIDCQDSMQKLLGTLIAGDISDVVGPHDSARAISKFTARRIHGENLESLRNASQGEGNPLLNSVSFFAGRAFAAGILEGTAEEIQQELLDIVTKEWKSPHPEHGAKMTIESGWRSGVANPLLISDSEASRTEALSRIESLLSDKNAPIDVELVLQDAALLDPMQYDRNRKILAVRLGFSRPTVFDQEVAKRRPAMEEEEEEELQGEVITIKDADPWPELVDGAALLDELSAFVRRYIYFTKESDADTIALYVLGTYCFDLFDLFAFLGITAIAEDSGKTTLAKWIMRIVYRPIPTNNITPAALFRLIAMYKGTLIIDEMDTFLDPDSDLYGILNSGHDKEMAHVTRTVGEDHEPRSFSTWCPRVWAMIGLPKRTVISRSIVIRLLRKPQDKQLERLPKLRHMGPEWNRLRRQCVRWAADNEARIQATNIDVGSLANRAADNWEPLFTLAQVIGDSWIKKMRAAAGVSSIVTEEAQNTMLLRDIRNIFHTRNTDRLPSAILVNDLCKQQESPWPFYDHHNPLTVNQLGGLLSQLGIKSMPMRLGQKLTAQLHLDEKWEKQSVRGFKRSQFETLFTSYLSGEEPETVETNTSQVNDVNF